MKAGKTLTQLAMELERQQNNKRDLLVEANTMRIAGAGEGNPLALTVDMGENISETFSIGDIAHRQMGTKLGIPAVYYDKCFEEDPALLAHNVNNWLEKDDSRWMVRTLDGGARAFLSETYRRIDNFEVANAVLPILSSMPGLKIESCELTSRRMYIKAVNPRVTAEVKKGDIVQAGIMITNSEVGQGSVAISPLIFRLVCLNGMVAQDASLRKIHKGAQNNVASDFTIYRDETIEANDRAFLMAVEDTVTSALDQAKFAMIVDRMQQASEAKMKSRAVPKVVELATKEYKFTQDEGKGILGHLIEGKDFTLYGLANAVTRLSQDVDSYDRATELEAAGWKVMNMPTNLWNYMNKAA